MPPKALSKLIWVDVSIHLLFLVGVMKLPFMPIGFDIYLHIIELFLVEFAIFLFFTIYFYSRTIDLKLSCAKELRKYFSRSLTTLIITVIVLAGLNLINDLGGGVYIWFYLWNFAISIILSVEITTDTEVGNELRRNIITFTIFFYLSGVLRIFAIGAVQEVSQDNTLLENPLIIILAILLIILWPATINRLDRNLTNFDNPNYNTSTDLYPSMEN